MPCVAHYLKLVVRVRIDSGLEGMLLLSPLVNLGVHHFLVRLAEDREENVIFVVCTVNFYVGAQIF